MLDVMAVGTVLVSTCISNPEFFIYLTTLQKYWRESLE